MGTRRAFASGATQYVEEPRVGRSWSRVGGRIRVQAAKCAGLIAGYGFRRRRHQHDEADQHAQVAQGSPECEPARLTASGRDIAQGKGRCPEYKKSEHEPDSQFKAAMCVHGAERTR